MKIESYIQKGIFALAGILLVFATVTNISNIKLIDQSDLLLTLLVVGFILFTVIISEVLGANIKINKITSSLEEVLESKQDLPLYMDTIAFRIKSEKFKRKQEAVIKLYHAIGYTYEGDFDQSGRILESIKLKYLKNRNLVLYHQFSILNHIFNNKLAAARDLIQTNKAILESQESDSQICSQNLLNESFLNYKENHYDEAYDNLIKITSKNPQIIMQKLVLSYLIAVQQKAVTKEMEEGIASSAIFPFLKNEMNK